VGDQAKADDKIEAAQAPGRQSTFQEILAGMDPEARQHVRSTLRASAMAARPDFEASRAARRQAVELMRGPAPDAAAANTLLDQSRAAEMRGRARLEHDATALLATLDPKDRQALAVVLSRRGKGAGPADPAPGRTPDPTRAQMIKGRQTAIPVNGAFAGLQAARAWGSSTSASVGRTSGRSKLTTVPAPGSLSMAMTPWCISISDLVRARPRPVPWVVLECWPSTCSNGRARRLRSSAAMPIPVSATATR
jgi:uncharacterized membrane protein